MNTAIFTQLSENDIRSLIRAELEAFFHDRFPNKDQKSNPTALGGLDLAEEVTGLKRPTLYALVQRQEIPHMKKGKKLYFKREELVAWIEEGRKATSTDIAAQVEAFTIKHSKRKS